MDAGRSRESRRLLEAILFDLEGVVYDYFCPEKVSASAGVALNQWLRCLQNLEAHEFDAARAAENCARWVEFFELYWCRDGLIENLPVTMETAFIERLEMRSGQRNRPGDDHQPINTASCASVGRTAWSDRVAVAG